MYNDSAQSGKYFYRTDVSNIEPHTSSETFTSSWRAPITPGKYTITISIDHFNSVAEDDGGEENNIIQIEFNVFGLLEPPELELTRIPNTPDMKLSWDPVENASFYQIFGGMDPYNFDLERPLTTTDREHWTDINAIESAYHYFYTIRCLDERGWSGPTGTIIGFYSLQFTRGYNSFSVPLQPFFISNASWYAEEMFSEDFETIYEYNIDHGRWIGHPRFLPPGMDDFKVLPGKSYMIYSSRDFNYTFTGRPETHLRFVESVAGDSWMAGDPGDGSFMQSLRLSLRQSGVLLQWNDVAAGEEPGEGLKYYEIYRTSDRDSLEIPTGGPLNDPDNFTELLTTTRLNRFIDSSALKLLQDGNDDTELSELHYVVVPVNELDRRGSSTYSVSITMKELRVGYNPFGYTLLGDPGTSAFEFIGSTRGHEIDTVYYYDREYQAWIGHPGFLPEFRDNPEMVMGEGYMVFIMADTDRYIYFNT
jgi:hypothetical protein